LRHNYFKNTVLKAKKREFYALCKIKTGVYGFVNFGHRPWWYRGHFCKKAGKNLDKKIISKRNNLILKKKENNWRWVKNTK